MVRSLSVVIPAYNEEKNLPQCLKKVHSVLETLANLDWEIIVVNDGSSDKTGSVAKAYSKKIPRLKVVENRPNLGYGGSLKAGFAASTKDFIVFIPSDNQFDFSETELLLKLQSETGADIVGGIRSSHNDPPHRLFLRWVWNKLIYGLFGQLSSDIDCGFKLFRREILEKITLPSDGAMIDTQLYAGARVRGLKIAELPVTHLPRTSGKSTGGNPKVALKAIIELFEFWWQLKQEVLVEQGRAVLKWEAFAIVSILVLAATLRLYKIDQYMVFLGDEGRDALVVREMALGQKFTLIGPGTSIGSMYLGPLYYYLMIPALTLFQFNPVGPAVQIALLGIATVGLFWWIGRQWFGRIPALVTTLFYAISPVVIAYSSSSWNPNIMPFFSLLTMYGVWKVWRYGYWRWLIISSVSFAFVLNSHYLGLLLLPPIALFLFLSRNKMANKKYWILGFVIWTLLMSPLFFFDLRHGWTNARAISNFLTIRQTTVNLKPYKALPHLWPIWQDLVTSLLTAKNRPFGQAAALIIFNLAFLSLLKRRSSPHLWFVTVWAGVGLIGLGLYKQHIYDHYYGFLFPAPFFLLGFGLQFLSLHRILRLLAVLSLFPILLVNFQKNPLRFPPNRQLENTRQIADFIQKESGNRPFNLALIAKSNYDASYRYFLSLNEAPLFTIHDQLTDQLFVICEDPSPAIECQPIGHPLWEIAAFGWAKIDRQWEFPWGVKVYQLSHNPSGK